MNKKTGKKSVSAKKDKTKIKNEGFFKFLWQKDQRLDLAIFLFTYAVIYILISIFYPYPDITNDSGNYILTAKTMTIGGYRPVGYSWFINFFHSISESIHFLFFGQYFIHILATLFFIFTIKYFVRPANKIIFYSIATLIILGPNSIYITNLIMSESIFHSLTLLFITSALWFNRSSKLWINVIVILLHLIFLFLAFNVRYVALFYPIISLACFLLLFKNKFIAVLLALLPVFVIFNSYEKTKNQMDKHIGIDVFSGFSGWAMANNAVSMIPHIDLDPSEIKDKELRQIHKIVSDYPDSVYNDFNIMRTNFIWDKGYPGKTAFFKIANQQGFSSYVKGWVYAGTLFNEYGKMLIKKYPVKYLKHFIWMNTKLLFRYWEIKEPDKYKPDKLQKQYFNLNINEYEYKYKFFTRIDPLMKIMHHIRWGLFILSVLFIIIRFKYLNFNLTQKKIMAILFLFLLGYFAFSIISHPINNYRYLIPTYAFMWTFPLLLANKIYNKIKESKSKK